MKIEFTKWDLEFLEKTYPKTKDFDAEIALKYTTKKDGINAIYATQKKLLAYITPTMAKRIVGVENFLITSADAYLGGRGWSDIVRGFFVEIKKVEK